MLTPTNITLVDNSGMPQEVGTIQFIRLSAKTDLQYRCHPRDVLTDEEVKQIATQLSHGKTSGTIGALEWRETS